MMFSASGEKRVSFCCLYDGKSLTISHSGYVGSSCDTDAVNDGDLPVPKREISAERASLKTKVLTGWREPTSEPL